MSHLISTLIFLICNPYIMFAEAPRHVYSGRDIHGPTGRDQAWRCRDIKTEYLSPTKHDICIRTELIERRTISAWVVFNTADWINNAPWLCNQNLALSHELVWPSQYSSVGHDGSSMVKLRKEGTLLHMTVENRDIDSVGCCFSTYIYIYQWKTTINKRLARSSKPSQSAAQSSVFKVVPEICDRGFKY